MGVAQVGVVQICRSAEFAIFLLPNLLGGTVTVCFLVALGVALTQPLVNRYYNHLRIACYFLNGVAAVLYFFGDSMVARILLMPCYILPLCLVLWQVRRPD